MPNHVSNKITLQCDPEVARLVFSKICNNQDEGGELFLDFNKLIEYPSRFAKADMERREWEKMNPGVSWSNAPKDGYNQGGYEWYRDNWGTKWNAYSQVRLSETMISFQTAWSAAKPVFEAISRKFPDVPFTVEYADEDIGRNAGKLHYKNGEVGHAELSGTEAAKLWFSLNPDCEPEEYGYDPETFEYVGEEE